MNVTCIFFGIIFTIAGLLWRDLIFGISRKVIDIIKNNCKTRR